MNPIVILLVVVALPATRTAPPERLGQEVDLTKSKIEYATPWERVTPGKAATSVEFYYRTFDEGGFRKAWVRYTERQSPQVVKRTVAYEAFDCDGDRSMTITDTEYRNGHAVRTTPAIPDALIPGLMQPIIPESVGDSLKTAVCLLYPSQRP